MKEYRLKENKFKAIQWNNQFDRTNYTEKAPDWIIDLIEAELLGFERLSTYPGIESFCEIDSEYGSWRIFPGRWIVYTQNLPFLQDIEGMLVVLTDKEFKERFEVVE